MITYVNSKDAKLFEMAAEDLGLESLDLDQYLDNLSALYAKSPKYVRLPLYEEGHEDEEIFEIDANARAIKIPASFSKNGVGIVSDELAETVWFKINRYFDIKDFGKAAGHDNSTNLEDGELHILIQWEAPDGAKGASWAYAVDADTDPEYIYFGWALTANHLTAQAGNIRFAVRIMQYNEAGEISYSFATQAAAVAVKASLNFDLTDEGVIFEEVADKISSRIMGGQIAYCPVFAPESQELPEGGNLPPYILDLEVPAGSQDNVAKAKLEVVAMAPNGTDYDAMAYKWYKKGANDSEFKLVVEGEDGIGQYTPALTVTSSGEYYVVVFGMIEIIDNNEFVYDSASETVSEEKFRYHSSIASSKSMVCEIPAPVKLDITEDIVNHIAIVEDANLVIVVDRQEIDGRIVGTVTLDIERTENAEKDLDLNTATFVPVYEPREASEAVTEAWIWHEVEYESEEAARAAVDAAAEASGGLADYTEIVHREAQDAVPARGGVSYEVNDDVITIDMSAAEEGYYRITVVNTLNGDHEDTLSSVICRVVKPAAIQDVSLQILTGTGNPSSVTEPSVHGNHQIKAIPSIEGLHDEILYQWYKVVGVQDGMEEDEGFDIPVEGANQQIYKPNDDGTYYCKVTNKVEDTEAIKDSETVVFTA